MQQEKGRVRLLPDASNTKIRVSWSILGLPVLPAFPLSDLPPAFPIIHPPPRPPKHRPAEKRGGAWMAEVVGRSKLLAPAGSHVRLPVAHMVCNQSPPIGGKPSLMTFREVETLFHEFGHALQVGGS